MVKLGYRIAYPDQVGANMFGSIQVGLLYQSPTPFGVAGSVSRGQAKVPQKNRVFALDRGSMAVLGSAWSDAQGHYVIKNLPENLRVVVIARDFFELDNAVVQDNVRTIRL